MPAGQKKQTRQKSQIALLPTAVGAVPCPAGKQNNQTKDKPDVRQELVKAIVYKFRGIVVWDKRFIKTPRFTVKGKQARLSDGTLAGSVATLMDCVKNAISFGIPKEDAFRMASETPAAYLNISKGKIEVGYDADFLVLDENLTPVKVFIGGKEFQ